MNQINPAMTANPNANADGLPNVAPATLNTTHSMATGALQPGQQPPANGEQAVAAAAGGAATTNNTNRQQVLRHQQQRLLLLRHAAKCPHENGKCPVTRHCAGMKRLWKHIAECKDQKCQVPHCVSSRYVLSHYHRCKDARCPVCMPVREAIHRSHEKAKQMNLLKQQHEQQMQGYYGEPQSKRQKKGGVKVDPRRRDVGGKGGMPQMNIGGGYRQQTRPGPYGYQHPYGAYGQPMFQRPPQVLMPLVTQGAKSVEDQTLINTFSVEQIERHIASLNQSIVMSPAALKTRCLEILSNIQKHQFGWVFNQPVDPVELKLPDYFEIIKRPMDLGTIKKRVENGCFHDIETFKTDCHLTFDNALNYNAKGSPVYNMALDVKKAFDKEFEMVMRELNAEHNKKCDNGEACSLCGMEKKLFEPAVFYCNGANCPSKRIRRNSYFYVAGNNQYHWCHQCFSELKEDGISLPDLQIKKSELARNKRKNDEQPEESWVACDTCGRWIHQICGLFNTRQNKDQRSKYECPKCTIITRKKRNHHGPTSQTKTATDLPRTRLSEYIEHHIRQKSIDKFKELAAEKAQSEGIELEEAIKTFDNAGPITIRQVASMDRNIATREGFKKRYKFKNYPDEFSYRCKCLVVFQEIDAVDVMLFGLYVYEHDDKNPKPNSRCVYVSYLDSVHYMQPRKIRTFIYHEILISYLDYVRHRGFATAHIWACPPLKGDDYILYAKPEDQRTPKDQQLRQWYVDMLDSCKERGIVKSVTNMYDLYFSDTKNYATIIPYLEGDYWVGEAENIIKELEDGGKKGKKDSSSKRKGAKTGGGNNSRGGTRSTGLDEDALIASGIVEPPPKSLEDGGKDVLMHKLGDTLQPMKDSFLVAYLDWEDTTKVRDKEVAVERKAQEKIEAEKKKKEDAAAAKKAAADKKRKDAEEKKAAAEKKKKEAEEEKKKKEEGIKSEEGEGGDSKVKKEEDKGDKMDVEEPEKPAAASRKSTRGGRGKKKAGDDEEDKKEDIMEVDEKEKETETPSKRGGRKGGRNAKKKVEEKEEEDKKEEVKEEEEEKKVKEEEEGTDGGKKRTRDGDVIDAVMEEKEEKEEKKEEPKSEEEIKKEKEMAEEEAFIKTWTKDKADEYYQERLDTEKERLESGETPLAVLPKKLRDPRTGRMCDIVDDDSETMDCEHLNSRQQFLNLCQGNHYQNNTLRNAKHTSMMVLWHLHNREAPKFVQQCSKCNREILLGYRYHCNICNDFDVCQDCMHGIMKEQPHYHSLTPIRIKEEEATEKQKKERARSIQLHMQLLAHAASCDNAKCPSANCSKMKGLLEHGKTCQKQAKGGCHVCKRIWALLQLHARQCKNKDCKVPSCNVIRENARRIMLQQQAMDDRRRMMMNQSYAVKR